MRFALCLPCLSLTLSAQSVITVQAPIVRVRLHPDEAWVTRTGSARVAGPGVHRLVLKELPPGLGLDDLRIAAKGPEGTRLGDLSVSSEPRQVLESQEYKGLQADREKLRDRRDALEAEGEAQAQELVFLKGLQAAYDKDISLKLGSTAPNPAAVVELGKGLQSRMGELFARDRSRKRDLERQGKEERRLDAEMAKLSGGQRVAPSRVSLEVATPRAGEVRVELSYRTRQALWTPAYEARLSTESGKVDLILYAAVTQRSGEDWSQVALEVSNARASRNLALAAYSGPQVLDWAPQPPLGRVAAKSMAMVEVVSSSAPSPVVAQNVYLSDAVPAESSTLEEAQGLSTTWSLDGSKEIPSDGEPHRFRVLAREVEAELALTSTPRLDPTVFQVARFPMPTGIPLFPGAPMVHFAGNQRLGQAAFQVPAAGKPVNLGFGPYRGLRVGLRQVEARKESVGTFTKESQWTLRERIEVSNDLDAPRKVEILDREIQAASDKVKVTHLPGSTPFQSEPGSGIRRWTLDLPAKGESVIVLDTQIRAPQEGFISGLGGLRLPN